MKKNIFRAYDIRGKYPSEINEKIAGKIISSLISKFKTENLKLKTIIIGYDARLSSPSLYRAILNQFKINCLKIKIIPAKIITTPMLSFLVNYFDADLGIMITASHNPKEYNGLKISGKKAVPINGKEVYELFKNLR